jgi:phosphatidyl-myo-inositol dimannoside synthase
MKVCLLTNDYPPLMGGISAYVGGLHQGINALGHECRLLFFPVNSKIKAEGEGVITHPVKGNWTLMRLLSSKRAMSKYREKIREADLVIVSAWSPLGVAYKALFPPPKPRSLLLTYGNDVLEPMRSAKYKRRMRETFEYFDLLAAISHYTASLCHRVTDKRVAVIGGGLDRRFLEVTKKTDMAKEDAGFTILSVGRLIERKGCGLVLQSLNRIRHSLSDWRYVIIGSGPYETDLRRMISEFALQANVMILNDVDDRDLINWYGAADLFVMVSREMPDHGEVEGLGLVYMEAGAARLPVIAGRSGGVADAVKEGLNGILVDPYSEEELSEALLKLFRESRLRRELGDHGRRLAEDEWRWEKVAERILAEVKQIGLQH